MANLSHSAFTEALDAALEDYRSRKVPVWIDEAMVERITSALLRAMGNGVQDRETLKEIALKAAAE